MKATMLKNHPSYKILIVDDDKAFLTLLTDLMKSVHDHPTVETARSGNECLRKIKSFSPNLVFLDIGMDGMNGLVTLRFIKSINPNTIVYLLSGLPEKYLKGAAGMVPADGYFTKPHFIELMQSSNLIETIMNTGQIST